MSLIDPFGWQISTFMAWSMEKGKKGLFMDPGFFRGKAGAAPQSIGCNRDPADGERYGGVVFGDGVCCGSRGTDIPRGVRFWPDWFDIPPYDEMHDMDGRRVYPWTPGIHTVQIRTGRRKFAQMGRVRDFSPEKGGYTSPVIEFTISPGD